MTSHDFAASGAANGHGSTPVSPLAGPLSRPAAHDSGRGWPDAPSRSYGAVAALASRTSRERHARAPAARANSERSRRAGAFETTNERTR